MLPCSLNVIGCSLVPQKTLDSPFHSSSTWASTKLHMKKYQILWLSLVRSHKWVRHGHFYLMCHRKQNYKENQTLAPPPPPPTRTPPAPQTGQNLHCYNIRAASKDSDQSVHRSTIRGMFEMNCLLSSSSISTLGTIKTNIYLYRVIQYLHNGV